MNSQSKAQIGFLSANQRVSNPEALSRSPASRMGISYKYHNFTRQHLKIKHRSGFVSTLAPVDPISNHTVVEQVTDRTTCVIVEIDVSFDIIEVHSIRDELQVASRGSDLARLMLQEFEHSVELHRKSQYDRRNIDIGRDNLYSPDRTPRRPGDNLQFKLAVKIEHSNLQGRAGMYFPEMDVTLSLVTQCEAATGLTHPFSLKHLNTEAPPRYDEVRSDGSNRELNIAIRAYDNTGHDSVSDRYVHIAGSVYKVPVIRDVEAQYNGVIIARNNQIRGEGACPEPDRTLYLSFEEAELKMGIARTVEAAIAGGSAKDITERLKIESMHNQIKAADLAHQRKEENELLKEQHEEAKRKHERELMELKKEHMAREQEFKRQAIDHDAQCKEQVTAKSIELAEFKAKLDADILRTRQEAELVYLEKKQKQDRDHFAEKQLWTIGSLIAGFMISQVLPKAMARR